LWLSHLINSAFCGPMAVIVLTSYCAVGAEHFPLSLQNCKSGISLSLSGDNGASWAVERCYHDAFIADQVLYLRSDVRLSLAHNERNTVTHNRYAPHVIGVDGADGVPGSGDEGDIYWKIDRDLQSHRYSSKGGTVLPDFCIRYNTPLAIDTLTYDGSLAVLGATGDNGGDWGPTPPKNEPAMGVWTAGRLRQ
jgi:hypothetical protein